MAVIAMIGQDNVQRMIQCTHDRNGGQLLAKTGVSSAGYEAARKLVENQLFGEADQMAEGIQAFRVEPDLRLAIIIPRSIGQRPRGCFFIMALP